VSAWVKDLRDVPQGVVGGAIDILFDSQWVTPTGAVAYGEDFTAFQQGTPDDAAGLINEAGALATVSGVGAGDFASFVAWEFARHGGGGVDLPDVHVQFAVDPGEGTATIAPANFALVGSGEAVDWALANLGTADLDLVLADFNGDDSVNHFDLALWQAHSGAALGDPGYDAMYDLNADSQIDPADLDLLMSGMYQPVRPLPALPESTAADNVQADPEGVQDAFADQADSMQLANGDLEAGERLRAVDALLAGNSLGSYS
jgi:hypothetical protein